MLLTDLVATSREVGDTRSRNAKVRAIADLLARLESDEVAVAVSYLAGKPRQDRLDLGYAAVRDTTPEPAAEPSLELVEVHGALQRIADASGTGSRTSRIATLDDLLGRATEEEQAFLRGLVLRELRQGALEGVMVQAIAAAAGTGEEPVRRALMVHPDIGDVAAAALEGGTVALDRFQMRLFHPVLPMLAATAADARAAVADLGEALVEDKIDGARVQVHRDGDEVRVYTRNLNDITHRVPDVVAVARSLGAERVVLDGEAIALRPDGRPHPFQVTMRRFGSEQDADGTRADLPLSVFLFDVLHLDGEDLITRTTRERRELLHAVVPAEHRVRSEVVDSGDDAVALLRDALARGHEGVMVKALDAPYEAGRRGSGWRKVKPSHTLDLVVLAAEWGSGRRRGWLSNLHLGARSDDGFVMLGKTFKGLTDEALTWQTEALLEREVRRSGNVVHVHPDLVVEIAFDGVQESPRYPGGLALRFARVKGYRPDKDASEADTLDTVRAIHAGEVTPQV